MVQADSARLSSVYGVGHNSERRGTENSREKREELTHDSGDLGEPQPGSQCALAEED